MGAQRLKPCIASAAVSTPPPMPWPAGPNAGGRCMESPPRRPALTDALAADGALDGCADDCDARPGPILIGVDGSEDTEFLALIGGGAGALSTNLRLASWLRPDWPLRGGLASLFQLLMLPASLLGIAAPSK
mmetsp:Transcript_34185/g.99253  ORF Transcript_34185/g.99253 Transcript_34185/m.99253 type:complete len:132 (+) Transcript_34185:755-1150(+)